MIENDQLRSLFQVECADHIEKLEHGLLRLEQNPGDMGTLEEVFRAAHSLKGAAGMVREQKVEAVAHRFEELLGAARRGTVQLSPETADRLYRAVDVIRALVNEAVAGASAPLQLDAVLTGLEQPTTHIPQRAGALPATGAEIARLSRFDSTNPISSPSPHQEPKSIPARNTSTMRVESSKLDALMSQAGELAVTRGRLAHRVIMVERLLELWEEWNGESHAARGLARDGASAAPGNRLSQLVSFLQHDRIRLERMGSLLKELDAATRTDAARVDHIATRLEDGIRSVRLLPFSSLFSMFPRLIRDLSREQGKEVDLVMEGGDTKADKRILEELKDPLTHMLRNAVDHGIESAHERKQAGKPARATVRLRASQRGPTIVIEVQDDGAGIHWEAVREAALRRGLRGEEELAEMSQSQLRDLLFEPGFSTRTTVTDVSGRGVGLDVVRANLEQLRGSIGVESAPGVGTSFRIEVPVTLATRRMLIASVGPCQYAIPVESILTTSLVSQDQIFSMEGCGAIMLADMPVAVARLAEILELRSAASLASAPVTSGRSPSLPCIILEVDGERFGLLVDRLANEQEVVLQSHSAILRRVRNVLGSTILQSGEVCVALNPHDLLKSVQLNAHRQDLGAIKAPPPRKKVVLLAEDSIVTRTQEKRILESAGFEVVTAVDGQDALNKLGTRSIDAIVSDVEMPDIDGLELTARVRQNALYKNLPIVLVTSLAKDEDRRRGMEVGADAYIPKPEFDQAQFIETVRRLASETGTDCFRG